MFFRSLNKRLCIVSATKLLLFCGLLLMVYLSTFLAILPARMAMARLVHPEPQGILVLGGSPSREVFAAKMARSLPDIPIWLSTGEPYQESRQIFAKAQVDWQRVHHDTRAVDTVTNFTSLVKDIQRQEIRHLYLVTSSYHMSRASAIATVVLGSRGIAFTPVWVGGYGKSEAQYRTVRDTVRAIAWIFTGRTGARLNPKFYRNTA